MSFSKARILRFNEIGSEAPPPGSYDPHVEAKIKGSVIEKTDRFQDGKSVSGESTESYFSVSSKNSAPVSTIFKMPLPRKRVVVKPTSMISPKPKPKNLSTTKVDKVQYNFEQEVADLKVECMNKDRTLHDYEKYIEEMKEETLKLQVQVKELDTKQREIEKQHEENIKNMEKLHEEILNNHNQKHETETQLLRSKLLALSHQNEREISSRQNLQEELKNQIANLLNKINFLEEELTKARDASPSIEQLKELEFETREKQNQLNQEWEQLRMHKENDIANLKDLIEKKENSLIQVKNEVQGLQVERRELISKLNLIEEDRNTVIQSLESEKNQLRVYIGDLKDERSNLKVKLDKRQDVILELQAQLSTLQCELDEAKAEHEKLIKDCTNQMARLTNKHNEEMDELKTDCSMEKDVLSNELKLEQCLRLELESKIKEITEDDSFLRKELTDVQRLYKDAVQRMMDAQQELENIKHECIRLMDQDNFHREEKQNLNLYFDESRRNYLEQIENWKGIAKLNEAKSQQIEEESKLIKENADKFVKNAQMTMRDALAACQIERDELIVRIEEEKDRKIHAMEEELHNTVEKYETLLTQVETDRRKSNEKLGEKDREITNLAETVEELKNSVQTQESFSHSLQTELDKAETELITKKEELRALKDQIRAEAAEMVSRRRRFDVIMIENQASIAALTEHLIQCNLEVDRLHNELKRGEDCLLEHKDLLESMTNSSQLVQKKFQGLVGQLDAKKDLVDQLETNTLTEFQSMKRIFEEKFQDLKNIAANEVTRLKEECDKKSNDNKEMKKQLEAMATSLTEAQEMLVKLEENNDVQSIGISKIQLKHNKMEEQLKKEINTLREDKAILERKSLQQEIALKESDSKAAQSNEKLEILMDKEKHFEERIASSEQWKKVKERLTEQIEQEICARAVMEEEVGFLKECNERLKKNYEEINEKYIEIIGHQNHKQRVKHVTRLKDKIYDLEQELQSRNQTIAQQQKVIEKCKSEEKKTCARGKENVITLSKSNHTTPVSSPHKPLTPLRERNE